MRSGVRTPKALLLVPELGALLEKGPRAREKTAARTVIDPLRLYGSALAGHYVRALPLHYAAT